MAEENKKFIEVENKWQQFWEEHPELYRAKLSDGTALKKYVLVEFPYPSGSGLHVGHAFAFTGGDVYARFKRMQGFDVLFPMGWDAFGLPTENFAIKTKRKPAEVTKENTDMFRSQMKHLAFSFDWSREVNTTDPNYYKWTQWIFIELFKKGLAYKKEMPINWCPSCKIGLANEEVVDGKCERCGSEVERRTISQWVVKITEYADRLIDGLKDTDFIEKVKAAQINWIGKSEGARVKFQISNSQLPINELEVFTTRPDTLYGATFMVVAPEHSLVSDIILQSDSRISSETVTAIKNYVKTARGKSEMERTELSKEKTGVFSGVYAVNPVTGKEIPIWVSDFVLASYGTGAIMAVPAHDERDWAFAKKFGLPIVPVINSGDNWDFEKGANTEVYKGQMINSEMVNGMVPNEAIKKMIEWLVEKGIGEGTSSYHLRDWIFSRQHYWGEPIPMIYCKEHGWQTAPVSELPIKLPEVEQYEPTDDGKSPLSKISEWVKTTCPVCGGEADRETDTMPNWAGSDWYYLSYLLPLNEFGKNGENGITDIFSASREVLEKWCPVDVYVGGDEHNTLHLLYSRFIYQFLYDLGVLPEGKTEPYFKRLSHGVILGPDNNRMSKSKGNVIVPETVADEHGIDVVRMYLMFMGPFDGTMAWNEKTLMGVKRFLNRFEIQAREVINANKQTDVQSDSNQQVRLIIEKLIDGVSRDIEEFGYNTAIAKMMEATNKLAGLWNQLSISDIKRLVQLLAPFAPYMSEELWSLARSERDSLSVHNSSWPKAESKYLEDVTIKIPVAVNGKIRSEVEVASEMKNNEQMVLATAKEDKKVKGWIEGKEIIKEIYVPGRMVNLVIR